MDIASSTAIFTTFITDVGDGLVQILPLVLTVVAALVALGYGLRWVGKKIGRKA